MAVTVTMPQLGESVTEGTVTRWLKQVGDTVTVDEPLLEISTDKVDTEIPSPVSGVLLSIAAGEDEIVLVGADLAVIGDSNESPAPAPVSTAPIPAPATEPAVVAEPVVVVEPPAPAAPATAPAAPATPVTPVVATSGTNVVLPALGESVTEGTVTRWLKAVGDSVSVDEPLLEISTDKVDTEIPSPAAGTLLSIAVAEDETAAVGAVLAVIGNAATAPAPVEPVAPEPVAPEPVAAAPTPAPVAPAPVAATPPPAASEPDDAYVTPLVRRLAAEHGVDLSTVTGTGVGGRIRKQDVLEAAKPAASTPTPSAPSVPTASTPAAPASNSLRGSTQKLSRLRSIIAERMVESLQTSAQLTTVVEVDVTRIAQLRDRAKDDFQSREGLKLSYMPFLALATVEALKVHPQLNATLDTAASTATYYDTEHLGIAVDTEKGLLVPVVRDAGSLNLAGLAKGISDVAERTRSNKLAPDELSGGTFTITNTGSRGALFDTPILNQPQVGILGTGSIVKRPVVITDAAGNDVIAIRQMMYLALTYDHRLVDGADAARFLTTIKNRLEEGAFESELGL